MKKRTKITLLVAVVMIALGATLCNLARGRGEDFLASVNSGAFTISPESVSFGGDQRAYTVCLTGEERFDASAVRALELNWIAGSVTVELHDGKELFIREQSRKELTEGQRMRWKIADGTLSVLFCANGESHVPDKSLTVLVPRDWVADQLTADTASASVALSGLTVSGKLEADTASGEVEICDVACREIDLDSISGNISVKRTAVSDTVEVDTTSGEVTLTELPAGCRAEVDTVSGGVTLRYTGKPGQITVNTISGDVTLGVPKGTELDMDYDSVSGRLSGELHFTPDGVKVAVDTASGDLRIEAD